MKRERTLSDTLLDGHRRQAGRRRWWPEFLFQGGDETISCTADSGVLSVQHGANPKQFNDRMVRVSRHFHRTATILKSC